MKEFEKIKDYYKPIQPALKKDTKDISYLELHAEKKIENFVYCFWQLKTLRPLSKPYIYRVVSDGCIDIFFDSKNPYENFIMGFCRKYTEFPLGTSFKYIGIRFFPAAFPLLFNIDAKLLSNRAQDFSLVLPTLSKWIGSEIKPNQGIEESATRLSKKLIDIVNQQKFKYDPRFFKSLNIIFQRKGFLDIEFDLNTGLSSRQLQRVFNYYIGTTAKSFSNVVRFQHVLRSWISTDNNHQNKDYFDVGFYDQAHFIKNFKTYYGIKPSKALG